MLLYTYVEIKTMKSCFSALPDALLVKTMTFLPRVVVKFRNPNTVSVCNKLSGLG